MQTHRHQADILIIGGGVCGLNAARAALARHGIGAPVRRSVNRVVADVVWRSAKRG